MSIIRIQWLHLKIVVRTLICFTSVSLGAEESKLREARIQSASLGLVTTRFTYKEFDKGSRLNREQGSVKGVTASWRGIWDSFLLEGQLAHFNDKVSYNGETQTGARVSTDTKETIREGAVNIGWRYAKGGMIEYHLLGGLGYREWDRDIQSLSSVAGLFETYYWWYGTLGVKALYRANKNSTLELRATLRRPVNPQIDVKFKNAFDDVNLDLTGENTFSIGLEWRYRLTQSIDFSTGLLYETWDLNKSEVAELTQNGVAIGTVFEPSSETEIKALILQLVKRF